MLLLQEMRSKLKDFLSIMTNLTADKAFTTTIRSQSLKFDWSSRAKLEKLNSYYCPRNRNLIGLLDSNIRFEENQV